MARYFRGDEFWELTRDGLTITTVTGKVGEPGTPTVEKLATPALAATRERVLLNKQGRDGWKLPKMAAPVVEAEAPAAPETIVHDARDPALERAIVEDPENDSQYEVYGDWLQQQGDPRGKAIALERATRGKTWGDKHHAQLNRFIETHKNYLYGPFETGRGRTLTLHFGFVARIELLSGKLAATLSELFAHPARRFVNTIHIDAQGDDEDPDGVVADLASALNVIAKSAPATLRHLEIGGDTALDDLAVLAPRFPQLRTFALSSIADRELAVGPRCMKALVNAKWDRLEELSLELLAGKCKIDHVAPLFAGAFPKLIALRVRSAFDTEIAEALATSKLAAQLQRLTFEAPGEEEDTDAFAEVLVRHKARFPQLLELGVPHQQFSKSALASLKPLAKEVRDADGEERYQTSWE